MGYELHIGPYRGRDPLLWRSSTGIVANGMELFEASLIPFATIADYLRDPEGYDPEASWRRAMRDVVGEADLEAFALFADNVRSSCLSADDAPIVVGGAGGRTMFRVDQGDAAGAAADLRDLADRLLAAAAHLLRGPVAEPGAARRDPALARGVRARRAGDPPHRRPGRRRATGRGRAQPSCAHS